MSATKEFYHDEICKGMETELNKAAEIDAAYWEQRAAEDAQIIAKAEEMNDSDMPNFLR